MPEQKEPYTFEDIVLYLKLSASYYNIFSALFRQEFTAEQWATFTAQAENLPRFGGSKSAAGKIVKGIKQYAGLTTEQQLIDLASLYARQFLSMGGKKSVSLAQSVYTSPKHLLCQDSFFAAHNAYLSQGLELSNEVDLTDDNLAVILAFMGYHAELVAQLPQNAMLSAVQRQNEFRSFLLLNWVDALTQQAKNFNENSLYTSLLEYMNEFVQYDQEQSELIVQALQDNGQK